MKIQRIALIALFTAGVASSYADTNTDTDGVSENKVREAAGTAQEIRNWKDDYRPRKELYDRYIERTQKLKEQDEKFRYAKDAVSYSEKRKETCLDQINELTGKIDKIEREAGALDMVAYSKVDVYKLQKQDMEKEVDTIMANIPYLQKNLEEATAHQKQAERDLREAQDRISKEYTHPENLARTLHSREKTISNLEEKLKREKAGMTPEEQKMLDKKIWDDFIAEGQKNAIPEPGEKPPHVAASAVKTDKQKKAGKPDEKAPSGRQADEEDDQIPDREPTAEELERARELVKTLKPITPDTSPLTVGGEQIISISCGTELMQSPDGKTIYTRLRSTELSSVTIVKDGKTYDISGVEATKILVRNGYFVHMANVGLVATNRYMDAASGGKSSNTGKSWRDDLQTSPMSPEDAAVYGGGELGGGNESTSDETPAWRKGGRSYPMSKEDEAVYGGALLGGGAASREHDTPMSQKDAATYGGGIIGGGNE